MPKNVDRILDFSMQLQQRKVLCYVYFIKDDQNLLDCLVGLALGMDSTQLHLMCKHLGEICKYMNKGVFITFQHGTL
jgi:hypothetical protein